MGAPGLTSPIRTETFQKLQLNAGIVLKNLTYDSITSASAMKTAIANIVSGGSNPIGTLVGATRGGGTFTATREIRTPEVDGMRYPFKGSDFVDSIDAYLSTTLIEVTPDNLAITLGASATTAPASSAYNTIIKMKTAIEASDYLTNICWVGDIANGDLVLICIKNAINTADFSLTFTDKGEGTIAAEFHARQAGVTDYDYAPFEIVYLGNASA